MPSSHLFITFGLYAHHFLIRLTQTLVFLSNLFSSSSFVQLFSTLLWEWQKPHKNQHTFDNLISNLKNLGMVCLHWQNKVIYPSHSQSFYSPISHLFSFSLSPNTSKNFLFPSAIHLYILTWRLIYIKTQLIHELLFSHDQTLMIAPCTTRQCIFPAFTA